MYHKIYNGLFAPYEAILLKGHLDENEVREALEDELGDKDTTRMKENDNFNNDSRPRTHEG